MNGESLVPATSNEAYVPMNVDAAVEEWNAYQNLCSRILDESDYQDYKTKEKGVTVWKKGKKKSAWQKLARAFNVNVEPVSKEIIRNNKTHRVMEAEYTLKATLPNGRTVVLDGSCDRHEKGKSDASNHTIKSTAETRAYNRVVSAVIGAGETSAEEMDSGLELLDSHEDDIKIIETDKEIVEPDNKPYIEPEFVTAEDVKPVNVDPVLLNYCKTLKNKVIENGKPVSQISMKSQLFKCIKAKEIDECYKKPLIDFINSHCPGELE